MERQVFPDILWGNFDFALGSLPSSGPLLEESQNSLASHLNVRFQVSFLLSEGLAVIASGLYGEECGPSAPEDQLFLPYLPGAHSHTQADSSD